MRLSLYQRTIGSPREGRRASKIVEWCAQECSAGKASTTVTEHAAKERVAVVVWQEEASEVMGLEEAAVVAATGVAAVEAEAEELDVC